MLVGLSLVSCLVAAAFGTAVFGRDPTRRLHRAFLVLSLAVAYWALCEFHLRTASDPRIAALWGRLFVVWPLAIAAFVHFADSYSPRRDGSPRRWLWATVYFPAAAASLIGAFTDHVIQSPPIQVPWGWTYGIPEDSSGRAPVLVWSLMATGAGLALCWRQLRSETGQRRRRSRIVLIGLAIPCLAGAVTEGITSMWFERLPELTAPGFAVGCLFIGYAIRRYRLFPLSVHAAAPGVVDSMADALLVADRDGTVRSANRAAAALLRCPGAEILGTRVADFWPESVEVLATLRGNPSPLTLPESSWRPRSGEPVPVSVSVSQLSRGRGEVAGYTLVARDLTQRRATQEQLQREQTLSRSLIHSLPGVFYLLDSEGRFVEWNRAFERIVGRSAEEMDGMEAVELFEGEDRQHIASRIRAALERGEATAEAALVAKDGTRSPHYFTGRRLELAGEPHVVGMGIDLTHRKELERQLLQSRKLQAVGTLAGGVAHDFNNLLTVILTNVDLALDVVSDPSVREDLEMVVTAGDRAKSLTNQLLQFSRRQVMQPVAAELEQIVTPLLGMLRRVAGEELELEVEFAPDLWPVEVDVTSIEQVIVNLVVNARDAIPGGGTIRIGAANVDDTSRGRGPEVAAGERAVRLWVEDDGVGIADADLSHVFEPFFTTKAVGEGSGLGLSVVYGIVEQHEGRIEVDSETGRGTRFDIYLPAAANAVVASDEAAPTRAPAAKGQRILVLEDEHLVGRIAVTCLRRAGYEVISVTGVAAALDALERRGPFALLFSDVVLPDGNGVDLALRLRHERPELRLLLTSGYTGPRTRPEEVAEHGLPFLPKPYSADQLLWAVSRQLRASRRVPTARTASAADDAVGARSTLG